MIVAGKAKAFWVAYESCDQCPGSTELKCPLHRLMQQRLNLEMNHVPKR